MEAHARVTYTPGLHDLPLYFQVSGLLPTSGLKESP